MIRISRLYWLPTFMLYGLSQAQSFDSPAPGPPSAPTPADVRIVQRLGGKIPLDAEFTDQTGTRVHLGQYFGRRPVVMLPIFYRCQGVCRLEFENALETMGKLRGQKVGRDFDVVILGIDPDEGPALAKEKFAREVQPVPRFAGTAAGWHLLTGDLQTIRSVTDELGFYFEFDAATDVVNHPSGIMFLSPSGVVSSYILGANYSVEAFSTDLAVAANGAIGQKSQDILFGCIHVDPLTGKRSIAIQRVVSLAGALTVIVFGVWILQLARGKGKRVRLASPD